MNHFKAVLFGATGSGKTELFNRLSDLEYVTPALCQYYKSVAADLNYLRIEDMPVPDDLKLIIWDTPGALHYKKMCIPLLSRSFVGFFCVDLSKKWSEQDIQAAEEDILLFQQKNPGCQLVLTGTKGDRALPQAWTNAQNNFKNIHFNAFVVTTSTEKQGLDTLYPILREQINHFLLKMKIPHQDSKALVPAVTASLFINKTHACLFNQKFRNAFRYDNGLLKSRSNAEKKLLANSVSTYQHLKADPSFRETQTYPKVENNALLSWLLHPYLPHKSTAEYPYEIKNDPFQNDPHVSQWFTEMLFALAVGAALIAAAGLIGYGIGIAIGSWTLPALVSAGVILGCIVGLGAMAYTFSSFFSEAKPTDENHYAKPGY